MKRIIVAALILVFVFWACIENKILSPEKQISKVNLNITGLEALGDSAWYEGWIVWLEKTPGGDITSRNSIGLLERDDNGTYSKSTQVNMGYIQGAQNILITIEEDQVPGYRVTYTDSTTDSTAGPSGYRVISALIAANSGRFSVGNDLILDFNFDEAYGRYILDTPTDTLNTNIKSGLWFMALDTTYEDITDSLGNVIGIDTIITKNKGLNLPELPTGWKYESQILFNGDTLSMGTFSNPTGSDSKSIYSDTLASGFPFPGEDFFNNAPAGITFPRDLSGAEILVTVRPNYPAKSNSPFKLNPFSATIPANAEAKTVYQMDNNIDTFPTGTISIEIELFD